MKGLKIIAVVGLVIVAGAAWGQVDSVWVNIYQHPGEIRPCSIVQTPDGGFALAGTAEYNFFLLKVEANSDSLWWRSYPRLAGSQCNRLILTNDGCFALAGYVASDRWDDYLLVKVDEDGDTLWNRVYGQGKDDSEKCNAVIQTADGGFALLGWYNTFNVNILRTWLLRTDANGDSLWSRIYEPEIRPDADLLQTEDGGFILVGGGKAVKTDNSGEIEWIHDFSREFSCQRVIPSRDGYAIAGITHDYDPFLTVLGIDGEVQWIRVYQDFVKTFHCSFTTTDDDGFLLAISNIRVSGVHLIRTAADGDTLWTSLYRGGEMTHATDAASIPGDGFVIGGSIFNPKNGPFVLRTPDEPFQILISEDSLGIESAYNLPPSTLLLAPAYPNPFNSTTSIPFSIAKPGRYAVEVVDISGRLVDRISDRWRAAGSYRETWNAAGVPAGEYLIRLQAGVESQVTGVQVVK